MIDNILGIDLGTSSVKLVYFDGKDIIKSREKYDSPTPDGWWRAVCRAAKTLDLSNIRAVGLSSQVGTYVVNGEESIGWSEPIGNEELEDILERFSREDFLREISMPHPRIISYPLPRLSYIKKHYKNAKNVCMPKDILCERLTGNCVSDIFSWRGLANLENGSYSKRMLNELLLNDLTLPKLASPSDEAGRVSETAHLQTGIPVGTPVYIGCNDFFSGLLGMGICESGDAFDITGTSEHMGVLRNSIPLDDGGLVCGPYFFENVHYGVTASSGSSFDLALELYELSKIDADKCLEGRPPVFLPYLCGERAPIWDSNARGVFFGIEKGTDKEALAYAVSEGVAFSIYHIYECMGKPNIKSITAAGGAGSDPVLNRIKASLFGIPVKVSAEKDCSALGAVICAALGHGEYSDLKSAIRDNCAYAETVEPDSVLGEKLKKRFEIYKNLYPALRDSFKLLNSK